MKMKQKFENQQRKEKCQHSLLYLRFIIFEKEQAVKCRENYSKHRKKSYIRMRCFSTPFYVVDLFMKINV